MAAIAASVCAGGLLDFLPTFPRSGALASPAPVRGFFCFCGFAATHIQDSSPVNLANFIQLRNISNSQPKGQASEPGYAHLMGFSAH